MSKFQRPFFIVSAPRSGSTLLRLIVDAHPNLAVPPPCWLFELIYPYLYSYGDLSIENNFRVLVEDVLETPTIKNWPIEFSVDQIVQEIPERSFAKLYDLLHRHYAEEQGKLRWGEKSPRDCFWMDEIRQAFSDCQFIHIVRDGRDQAIDIAESPSLLPFNIYAGVHMWQLFVSSALESASRLGQKNYFEIRYEQLCAEPESEMRRLCEFLREDFDTSMLQHHESSSSHEWGARPGHEKAARPITTEYCEMHRTLLNSADRAVLDSVIGDLLEQFDYPVNQDKIKNIDPRLANQLRESDTVSSLRNAGYKRWHQERRRERREREIWSNDDRSSMLWGLT